MHTPEQSREPTLELPELLEHVGRLLAEAREADLGAGGSPAWIQLRAASDRAKTKLLKLSAHIRALRGAQAELRYAAEEVRQATRTVETILERRSAGTNGAADRPANRSRA